MDRVRLNNAPTEDLTKPDLVAVSHEVSASGAYKESLTGITQEEYGSAKDPSSTLKLHESKQSMTDTIMPVAPSLYPYGAAPSAYNDNCLGDVMLANQLSSGFADVIAATHNGDADITNNVTMHALRNNDAINDSSRSLEKSIADVRTENQHAHCETQKLVLEKFAVLQNQMTKQHGEITNQFLVHTNEGLKAQLLDAKLAALQVQINA